MQKFRQTTGLNSISFSSTLSESYPTKFDLFPCGLPGLNVSFLGPLRRSLSSAHPLQTCLFSLPVALSLGRVILQPWSKTLLLDVGLQSALVSGAVQGWVVPLSPPTRHWRYGASSKGLWSWGPSPLLGCLRFSPTGPMKLQCQQGARRVPLALVLGF